MYDFKRILVCLDLTDHDKYLIEAAANWLNLGVADHIYFFHVTENLDLSNELLQKYPTLAAPLDERLKQLMDDEIKLHFNADVSKCESIVVDGNRFDEILKWSRVKFADLIIMGKKPKDQASFELPEKIIQLIHTSVLLVPAFKTQALGKLLVPTDFSEASSIALHQAVKVQKALKAEVVCLNIYRVPTGFHSTGKTYDEFAQIMKGHAEKDFQVFLETNQLVDQGITCEFVLEKGNAAQQIHAMAEKLRANAIIMGSKGRTQMSNVVLGSTAMKMVKHEFEIPVLIVKDKAQTLGFFDALRKI